MKRYRNLQLDSDFTINTKIDLDDLGLEEEVPEVTEEPADEAEEAVVEEA